MRKVFISIITVVVMFMALTCQSFACSSIYVGSKVSADGSTMITRSNDLQGVTANNIIVVDRVEDEPGRTMPVDEKGKTLAELPDTTYKYIATPFMDSALADKNTARDAAVCTNEYGVAMTMSVTAFSNNSALKADPLVETGLIEDRSDDLVICQSKTAREAVKVLLGIIDKFGSAEVNIALIADQKEAWYVEMYSGHQYAAVKLPDDKVSAFGNEFNLEYLSDYEESITSKELETLPKKEGFAVYGKNKELNLWDTYSGAKLTSTYSHMRTWMGHKLLAPSRFGGDYQRKDRYPLCFVPDEKVSLTGAFDIMRNRYEGTRYDPDKTGRKDMRVIGSDTSMSVHVVQVYPELPADMSNVIWECTGPAPYGVFVPVSNAVTSVDSAYGKNQPTGEAGNFDVANYPYYAFKGLNTQCMGPDNYEIYGAPVKDYWKKAEKGMTEGMTKVLANAKALDDPADYMNGYCGAMQDKAFKDAKALYKDVEWTKAANANTFEMGLDPETHQVLDKEVKLPPMEVDLDPSAYSKVPDPESAAGASGGGDNTTYLPILIGALVLAVIAVSVFILKRK